MRAIVTVIGSDKVGIIASICSLVTGAFGAKVVARR